jgi:hypothetical protein
MPFWSQNFAEDTTLKDPKRQFRFMVEFQGISAPNGGAALWYAKSAQKPSFEINAAEHKYLNHTFYYPGNVTWQPLDVVMVDPVEPDVTATLSDIIAQSGYTPPTDATSRGSISKATAAGALGTVIITQLDAAGNPLETWTLWNAFITTIKYTDLSYGEDALSEATCTLRYDWARVETANASSAIAGAGGNSFFGV